MPLRVEPILDLPLAASDAASIQHHSVADKVVSAGPEYAGRYGVKHEALVSGLYGMAGVGSALEAGYDAVSPGKYVHYLAFSLVSPLEAEYYVYFCSIFVHVAAGVRDGKAVPAIRRLVPGLPGCRPCARGAACCPPRSRSHIWCCRCCRCMSGCGCGPR